MKRNILFTFVLAGLSANLSYAQQLTVLEKFKQGLRRELSKTNAPAKADTSNLIDGFDDFPKPFIAEGKSFTYEVNNFENSETIVGTITLKGVSRQGKQGVHATAKLNSRTLSLWLPYRETYLNIVNGTYTKEQHFLKMLTLRGALDFDGMRVEGSKADEQAFGSLIKSVITMNDPERVKSMADLIKMQKAVVSIDKDFDKNLRAEQGAEIKVSAVSFQGKSAQKLDFNVNKDGRITTSTIYSPKHELPIVAITGFAEGTRSDIKLKR